MKEHETEEMKQIEEIKEKISNLYENLSLGLNEKEKITKITFYKELQIVPQREDNIGLAEDIYFIEKEIDKGNNEKEKVHELYLEEGQRVAIISKDGEIIFDEAYLQLLKERFKGLYSEIKIEDAEIDIEKILEDKEETLSMSSEEIEEHKKENDKDNENKIEKEQTNEEEEKVDQIAEATGVKIADIRSYTKINPNEKITDTENFYDIVPDTKQYEEIYVVASKVNTNQNSMFYFVGVTKEGNVEPIEEMEPTEGVNTTEDVISINRDGTQIKEKKVSALFRVGNYNRGFSVSIGNYGVIQTEYVRRTPDDNYISSNVNTTTQMPTTKEVEKFMSETRNPYMQDNVDKAKKQMEESVNEETNVKDIDDNEYNDVIDVDEEIRLQNGTITTIRREAEKAGIELEEYVRRCEEEPADTIEEKIDKVNEQIEKEKEEIKQELEQELEEEGEERTPWGDAYRRMMKNL